jgi:hypothetical protein
MLTIHKFPFRIEDRFDLKMPRGASILRAECQQGQPCLWALVDTSEPIEEASFRVYGTGQPIDPQVAWGLSHVDTFQQGPMVWHLFRAEG